MKKNYPILFLTLICILFCGCKKEKSLNYSELLQGIWVNTMVNDQAILTDNAFVMELKSDGTEMYAIGVKVDDNNKSWQENNAYQYTVNGDIISINGADVAGKNYQMNFKIISLDKDSLKFSVSEFKINGEPVPDEKIYTFKKVNNDYKEAFTGIWYGKCTTPGNADSLYHYWEYFKDGSFNYYYQDKNNKWIKKSDNQGRYFLYGQLMVSNYSHDLNRGGTGLTYEGWNVNIEGNKMVWSGIRENNVTITYEMEKVTSAPKL